ncbi:MAG: (2Fe-2S)-binding protein [Blastocatellia bacterium]|nr:(2Fe-2S)-binding protein [Blastocatellia bacterium]
MPVFSLTVNHVKHSVNVAADTPLLWVLRDTLNLTGTKYGCGLGICGACTIHLEGKALRACQIPISEAAGKSFVTIEGLSANGDHPCQRAWVAEDVSQCGFCQPGMIMATAGLLAEKPNPSKAEIELVLSEHVCRCGTYCRVRKAVQTAIQLTGGKK